MKMWLTLTVGILFCLVSETYSDSIRIPLRKGDSIRQKTILQSKTGSKNKNVGKAADEPLKHYYDTQYSGRVSLGTPPQWFTLIFDTVAFLTWVPSARCLDDVYNCGSLHVYDSWKSYTYKANNTPFYIPYVKGAIKGILSTDTLTVGGVPVANQTFGEVTQQPGRMFLSHYDGIFGLGFMDEADIQVVPPFYNMFKQNLISSKVFSVFLSSRRDNEEGGEILFGGINPKHYEGNFNYVSVSHEKYWGFQLEDIQISNNSLCGGGCHAILNTATSMIIGPNTEINKIFTRLNAYEGLENRYSVQCSQVYSFPSIEFYISGVKYRLNPDDYVLKYKLFDALDVCDLLFTNVTYNAEPNLWILGDVFMRKYYTTFDLKMRKIGFATAIQS